MAALPRCHCDGDVLRELVRPVLARQQAACRLHCSSEFAQHPLRAAVPAAIGKQHEGDELHRIAVGDVVVLVLSLGVPDVADCRFRPMRRDSPAVGRRSGMADRDVSEQSARGQVQLEVGPLACLRAEVSRLAQADDDR